MDLTKITDHIERAQGNLFSFLQASPKIMALVAIIVAEIQALENVGYDLIVKRWLPNAEGYQLDVIGLVVGEPRAGLSDDDYRFLLYIVIDVNHSQGGAAEITNAAARLTGARVHYRRAGIAGFSLEYLRGGTQLVVDPDMEAKGPDLVTDGDMEALGAELLADGDMEAGPGPEELGNGTFTNWIAGTYPDPDEWTTTSPDTAANHVTQNPVGHCQIVSDGTDVGVSQDTLVVGRTYHCTIDVEAVTSGSGRVGGSGTYFTFSSPGIYNFDFVADSTVIHLKRNAACDFSVDSISIVENAPAWQSENNGLLTKSTADPYEGLKAIRTEYTDTNNPSVMQAGILTVGKAYRITGWARGDGSNAPRIRDRVTIYWLGTSSTAWQLVDLVVVAGNADFLAQSVASSTAWAEFDLLSVKEIDLTAWGVWRSADLSKIPEERTGGSGSLSLRVAYGGTSQPAAKQDLTTAGKQYRITGWARGDGTFAPQLQGSGVGLLWAGSSSTTWQYFDVTFNAVGVSIYLYSVASAAGWADFDDVTTEEMDLTAWTPINDAELWKYPGGPGALGLLLQVDHDGTSFPYARQQILTVGTEYRMRGWARGDGANGKPRALLGLTTGRTVWDGTTSTDWQYFDITGIAVDEYIGLQNNATAAGFAQFDNVLITDPTDAEWLDRAVRLLQRATLCGVNWQMVEGHTTKPFRFGGSPGSGFGDGHLGRTSGSMT